MRQPLALLLLGMAACAGSDQAFDPNAPAPLEVERLADGTPVDDRSLCDFQGRDDVEVTEIAGPGSTYANVRRVWKVYGTGADARKVLECREADTNLDGVKDVVRFYNEDGQSKEERADSNHDGKIDTWITFAKGRVAEVRLDTNHDGVEDEWKIYVDGKLTRVKRDTDFDSKPDVWEMYSKGRLQRMGVDLDGDGRVDRWDHDAEWRKQLEAEARRKEEEEEEERKRAAAAAEERAAGEGEEGNEAASEEKPDGDSDGGS